MFKTVLLVAGDDEIVAATINLDNLDKNEVLDLLKVLQPYENNMKVLRKKDLSGVVGLGSLGLGLKDFAEVTLPSVAVVKLREETFVEDLHPGSVQDVGGGLVYHQMSWQRWAEKGRGV